MSKVMFVLVRRNLPIILVSENCMEWVSRYVHHSGVLAVVGLEVL